MNHREAFIEVKKFYGIENKALHLQSGVSLGHISKFINYKQDATSESLDKLVNGMDELAPGAKKHYCQLLLGKKFISPEEMVEKMDGEQIAELVTAIGSRLRNQVSMNSSHSLVS